MNDEGEALFKKFIDFIRPELAQVMETGEEMFTWKEVCTYATKGKSYWFVVEEENETILLQLLCSTSWLRERQVKKVWKQLDSERKDKIWLFLNCFLEIIKEN